jgi:hypothetical protein
METTCQFNKLFVVQSFGGGDCELHTGVRLVQEVKPTIEALGLGVPLR